MNCVKNILKYEMVHFDSDSLFIAHRGKRITYANEDFNCNIRIPTQGLVDRIAINFRVFRRLFRLDKMKIVPFKNGFIMIRKKKLFYFDIGKMEWHKIDFELNCRNPMYNGVCTNSSGDLFVCEYGRPNGIGKRIIKITEDLRVSVVYQFLPNEIRHIHCIYWHKGLFWVCTGDADGECGIYLFDDKFELIKKIGDGSQLFRTCHLIFEEDFVTWIMDSPIDEVKQVVYYYESETIDVLNSFAGPVWFAKKINDIYYASSAQEIGPSHKDNCVHIYSSTDLKKWEECLKLKPDILPKKLFRFSTVVIANSSRRVLLCCEAVKRFDGKTICL